jgi:hypothetical protein
MDKLEQEFGEVFSNLGASMQNIKIPTDKEGITSVINANPQLKQVLQKLRGQEKQSPQPLNEEVSVILVLGILLAAPKIIELIVGAVNKVINSGRIFTQIKNLFRSKDKKVDPGKEKQIGNNILKYAHKWHEQYVNLIKKSLYIVPRFGTLNDKAQSKIAATIYNIAVAYLMISSGTGAVHAASHGHTTMAGIEGALSAVKANETVVFLADAIGTSVLSLSFNTSAYSHDDDLTDTSVDTSTFTGFKASSEAKTYKPKISPRVLAIQDVKNIAKQDIIRSLEDREYGLFDGKYTISKNIPSPSGIDKIESEVMPQIKNLQQEMIADEQAKVDATQGKRTKTLLNILKKMQMHVGLTNNGKYTKDGLYVHIRIDYTPKGAFNPLKTKKH